MSNNKKINKAVFIILLLMILVAGGVFFTLSYYNSNVRLIEKRWNIAFPKNITETYAKKTKDNWFGEAERYVVYHVPKIDDVLDEEYSVEKDQEIEKSIDEILSMLEVKSNKKPDFNEHYAWRKYEKGDDKLYMLYFESTQTLYIVESIF